VSQKLSYFRSGDWVLPLIIFVATTVYLAEALRSGAIFRYGLPSAGFMPIALSLAMYLSLLAVVWGQIRRYRARQAAMPGTAGLADKVGAAEPLEPPHGRGTHIPLIAVIVISFLYVLFFRTLGFAVTTFLFSLGLLAAFRFGWSKGAVGLALNLLVAGAITLLTYLFFAVLFGIQLPRMGVLS